MTTPVIEVENLSFSFNHQPVLNNVNLSVFEYDFLALIGPNGGGKTTLLKLMIGLLKPDHGTVRVFGQSPGKVSHRIGYVPQYVHANDSFPISVLDVVLMGRLHAGHSKTGRKKNDREIAGEALDKVEMADFMQRRIGELSGGQRQRVFIARALATHPDILFLDEPTASVDTHGQTELYEILKALNKTTTIVVISHDIMVLSPYIKAVACVNKTLHYHGSNEITPGMIDAGYTCPVELVAHGVPHRVLKEHK